MIMIFDSMVIVSLEVIFSVPANGEESWELVDLDLIVEGAEVDSVLFLFCDRQAVPDGSGELVFLVPHISLL